MKKNNKKGFTLIELLAVIIILGVIMLIAIPSVTSQISNSRKNTYSKTAQEFINSVIKIVNAGNMEVFDTATIYAIPVGNETDKSCIKMESGGTSPYSNTYKYAYVWFTYDGNGYDYYVTVQDATDQGIITTSSADLSARTYNSAQLVGKHQENATLKDQYESGSADLVTHRTCAAGATDCDADKWAALNTFATTAPTASGVVKADKDASSGDSGLKKLLADTTYNTIHIFKTTSCVG